jgi:hypothetical protein
MKILILILASLSLVLFTGCDLNLLSESAEVNRDSKNSSSSTSTTTTTRDGDDNSVVNPAGFIQVRGAGETISVNEAGETIITNPDGSVENVGDVNNPDTSNSGLLFLLASLSLAFVGCTTRNTFHGDIGSVRIESGTKANASMSLSGYARGSALETEATESEAKEDGQTWIDTQGGGEVAANANTKVGQGNDSQAIEADGVEDVAE